MQRLQQTLGAHLLGASLVMTLTGTGCAARGETRVRFYDRDHEDWHDWDDREEHEYRRYLNERHRDYRDFRSQNDREKREYWEWRHSQQ